MQDAAVGVRVAYRPTVQDYLAIFARFTLQSRRFVAARYLSLALALFFVVLAAITGGRRDVVFCAGLMILATLSLWVAAPALIRRGISNRFGSGATPPAVEYRVDEQGVHGKAAWAAWSDIVRVKETPEAFFVWMRPGAGAYLPKWAMAAEDTARVRGLFETHLGGRAQLGPR